MLLLRQNFKGYFENKEEIKTAVKDSYDDGIELPNLKLYLKGVTLTLFYILLAPLISSLISLVLAFISPIASMLSFLLILIFVFIIRMKRSRNDDFVGIDLTEDEMEFLQNIKKSIYGDSN